MKRNATALPELVELVEELERRGVPRAADEVLRALTVGPGWYAQRLGTDDEAWHVFERSSQAVRAGRGEVADDPTTLGALTWTYLHGPKFLDSVMEYAHGSRKQPVLH